MATAIDDINTSQVTAYSDLACWLLLDEDTASDSCVDLSGNSRNGTPQGASGGNNLPQPVSDTPGVNTLVTKSRDFDSTDDRISLSAHSALLTLPPTENFSVSFWAKQDETNNLTAVAWDGSDDLSLYPCDNSTTGFRVFWRSYGGNIITGDGTNRLNAWHHFVFVCRSDGDQATYIDGSSIGTGTATATSAGFNDLYIGQYSERTSTTFSGRISDVRFYTKDLSSAEITSIYGGDIFAPSYGAAVQYYRKRNRR